MPRRVTHKEGGDREAYRVIVPVDLEKDGLRYYGDEIGPGDKAQWWIDTGNFEEDAPATPGSLWSEWAI